LDIFDQLVGLYGVVMGEDEVGEGSEVRKSIDAWRQSERKIMIETVQDLIQTSHKYAKSQYTPNAQRVGGPSLRVS